MCPKHIIIILVLLALSIPASPAHAGSVVTTCDEPHLLAAMAGGGTVTFSCSGTITLSSTITVATDTTVDGSGQNVIISGNHAVRVFTVNPEIALNLNMLTIANGRSVGDGGGIQNDGGLVTISNSTLSSNTAAWSGGGISNYHPYRHGTVTVSNSTFSGNSADNDGGGIANFGGTVMVSNSIFSGNSALGSGGGIVSTSTLAVSNSTFSGNSASIFGGGIYNTGEAIVSNSTFSANSADGGGGILNAYELTVSNSTFSGNSAAGYGGAIFNFETAVLTNSTLSGNSADGGGGIFNNVDSSLTLRNTVVANSPSGSNCYAYVSRPIVDGGGNLSFGDNTCPGISGDPKLGPLQNNGGPTETMALGAGSAARDAANDATCAAAPVNNLDQRGVTRPQGAHCDIGAYEALGNLGNIVSICDEAHLLAALAGGGTVTFTCSGTITLSSMITAPVAATIIDGSGQNVTISGNHAVRLFYIPAGSSLTLRNLNLVNGQADSDSGGAIYNLGSLVVAGGNFESNSAELYGGAILNYGTADVSDTMFFRNEAGVNGGAIDSTAQLSVHRSRFIENTAGFRGGAVNNYLGTITVEESLFGGNRSSGYGGGLVNDGGNALIRGSRIALNSASDRGGGIKNSGILYVFDSTLSDNRSRGGGGILNEGGTVTVSNSTFSGNSVMEFSGFGGGILNDGGTMGVINSTFSGNGAYFNCGGGISNNGTLTLKNTIVANSPRGDNCDSVNSITDGGGNLSFGDSTCPGINGDPQLGPLQDNGGPTYTMALGAGSAAIDAANDATCAAAPISGLDQRGVARPQGAHCDIGAFEVTDPRVPGRVFLPIISRAQ
ncbi:MAG: hypothetical protein IPM84_04725 [Anaerolineae bacterium]|nr:hypothetical protein [Anaerolineae bacterium]